MKVSPLTRPIHKRSAHKENNFNPAGSLLTGNGCAPKNVWVSYIKLSVARSLILAHNIGQKSTVSA
jgi:hypothetical protein